MDRSTDPASWPSPWHRGEQEAQRRAGVEPQHIAVVSGYLRPYLNEQHRAFYPRLPFIVAGTVDEAGRPWATILDGQPGFLQAEDGTHLRIGARALPDDPAAAGFAPGRAIGLLGIELETRRRNRLNGVVAKIDADGMQVEVDRAYGNCPKYIHTRDMRYEPAPSEWPAPEWLDGLDAQACAAIAATRTFFVASYTDDPMRQVDVSHRGGRAGFVEVDGDWLTIPDFTGNQFYNTLGNFLANPRAGLLFPDFASGDVLQVVGRVEVSFDSPRLADFQGAERLWRVKVETAVRRRGALRWRGTVRDESAEAELTGTWAEARERSETAAVRRWRRFQVDEVVDETAEVRSFVLRPLDGPAASFGRASMHLVLRLPDGEGGDPLLRSYSLSRMPDERGYRISVKADGAGSREIHRRLAAGVVLDVHGPQGDFVVDVDSPRPVVLMSAGIGITPMRAMAEQLLAADVATGRHRRVHFLHGARHGAAMPFRAELQALQDAAPERFTLTRCFSRPEPADQISRDFEFVGHLGIETLKRALPFDDHDFYLCGPATFMQQTYDGLRDLGIADERIFAEGFGPSALVRRPAAGVKVQPPAEAATTVVEIQFARTGGSSSWKPGGGTLLELAERAGLQPEFGCRDGTCGTCRTRVLAGEVAYPGRQPPTGPAGTALICCAVPARASASASASSGILSLDL